MVQSGIRLDINSMHFSASMHPENSTVPVSRIVLCTFKRTNRYAFVLFMRKY